MAIAFWTYCGSGPCATMLIKNDRYYIELFLVFYNIIKCIFDIFVMFIFMLMYFKKYLLKLLKQFFLLLLLFLLWLLSVKQNTLF